MKKTFPLFLIICIALIVCGIIALIFEKKIKGWFWKQKNKQALKKLPKDKYIVLNNIFIEAYRSIHQIDHLVISQYGIFSIMTKQYTGFISGRKFRDWFRFPGINKRKKGFGFPNPIRQNYYHVEALANLLFLNESKIYNIVCFPSRARLDIIPWGEKTSDGVIARNTTIVKKILSFNDIVIDDINPIIEVINKNRITDKTLIKKHIRNIEKIEYIRNMKKDLIDEESNKCPECGSPLIFKYGRFPWIQLTKCSNYPTCKYIKKEKLKEKEICECLICGGKIVEKGGFREKVFYECSNYQCNAAYTIIDDNFFNMLSSSEENDKKHLSY